MAIAVEREQITRPAIPLYLLRNWEMPIQQINDLPTAIHSFCKDTDNYPKPINLQKIFSYFQPFTIYPDHVVLATPDTYQNPEHRKSIHGEAHQARVAFLGKAMAVIEELSERESDLVYLAGQFHDTQREVDNNSDQNHGLRAKNRITTEPIFKTKMDEYVIRSSGSPLTNQELEIVGLMCEFHEYDYQKIPPLIKEKYGKFLVPMMNADRLDRFRSPSELYWPDPRYFLSHPEENPSTAAKLYEFSRYFSLASELYRLGMKTDVTHATLVIALELGLIKAEEENLKQGREHLVFFSSDV